MNKEQIIKKMQERGYSRNMESRNAKDETVSITFTNDTPFGPWYAVTVWVEDGEFQLTFSLKTSINKLITPKCGSFMNDEHFNRIVTKFEREVKVLDKHCK